MNVTLKISNSIILTLLCLALIGCGPNQYNPISGDSDVNPSRESAIDNFIGVLAGVFWSSGRGGAFPDQGFNLGRSSQIGPDSVVVTRNYNIDSVSISTPALVNSNGDSAIFLGTSAGQLHAFNANDPESLTPAGANPEWSATGLGGFFSGVSIGPEGFIYVAGFDGKLYSYTQAGVQRFAVQFSPSSFRAAPAIALDGTIYLGDFAGTVYSITDNDGVPTLNWKHDFPGSNINGEITVLSDTLISTALNNGVATKIVGLNSGLSPATRVAWEFTPPTNLIISTGAYYNVGNPATEMLVYGSDDTKVYALNGNGNSKWTNTLDGRVKGAPAVAENGDVYVTSQIGTLYAFNVNGALKWSVNVGTSITFGPVIDTQGTLFLVADEKLLSITDNGSTFTQNWQHLPEAGHIFSSSPTISDGAVFMSQFNFAAGIFKIMAIYDN